MADPAGETSDGALRLDFDTRSKLQFRGAVIISDAGLLAYRELDDALGLTACAGEILADARTGKNGRHALVGLLRQSVFGRLAAAYGAHIGVNGRTTACWRRRPWEVRTRRWLSILRPYVRAYGDAYC